MGGYARFTYLLVKYIVVFVYLEIHVANKNVQHDTYDHKNGPNNHYIL